MPNLSPIAPPWILYGAAVANYPAWVSAVLLLLLYRRYNRLSTAQVRRCYRVLIRGMLPPDASELLPVRDRLTKHPKIQAQEFCRFAVDALKGHGIPATAANDNPDTLAGIFAQELGITPRRARKWYDEARPFSDT